MMAHVRLVLGLLLVVGLAGVASGQRSFPSVPAPAEKAPPAAEQPKVDQPPPAPVEEPRARPSASQSEGVLSDLLTVFIYVVVLAGVIVAMVLAASLFFRLRAAEDPLVAALDDAWVQGRLRELEANPPQPDEEEPVGQAEDR